jgi:3-oxoacyl-(acyl-carrier-protein) synthase
LFALAGAILALRDAGLSSQNLNQANTVIVAGACVMDFEGILRTVDGVLAKGLRGAFGRAVYTTNAASIAATVGHVLEIEARSMSVQSSCCTGLDAIGHAARLVAHGEAEIAICGGTDAPLFRCPLVELRSVGMTPATTENARALDRPFDLWRTTGVVSEGAAMVVLEPETSPRQGYCYVDGYAYANDAPEDLCGGMATAMQHALADARVRPWEVDSISAWGPGHRLIDAAESRSLEAVFGEKLAEIPTYSIKGSIGNPLGAAGAIQTISAALSARTGCMPATVNWRFPDPACPLNLSGENRTITQDVTLINAHGLSGVNASLIVRRC